MQEKFTLSLTETADEINVPLEQLSIEIWTLSKSLAQDIYNIGRRLLLAKQQIAHGHFTKWVTENTPYSHSTANNFMNAALAVDENPALAAFPHTKVLALLDVPAEDREQFMAENDVDNMSTREIKRLVKEKEAAEQEAERQREAAERNSALVDEYAQNYYDIQSQLAVAREALQEVNTQQPTEIEVEVPPADYDQIKQQLLREKARADAAEAYAEEQEAAYQTARQQAQRLQMQQIDHDTNLTTHDPYGPQEFTKAVQSFMASMGTVPHMSSYFATKSADALTVYSQNIDALAAWVRGAQEVIQNNAIRLVDTQADVR